MFTEDLEVEDTAVDSTTEDNQIDNETHSDSEDEAEETTQGGEQRKPETPEAKRARLKRQLERLNKQLGVSDEEADTKEVTKESSKESSKEVAELKEEINRLRLAQNGYAEKKEQDALIKYAAFSGLDLDQVTKDPVALAIVKGIRDKAATPSSSARTSKGGTVTIDTLIQRYNTRKYLTPSEMKQVRDKLRR